MITAVNRLFTIILLMLTLNTFAQSNFWENPEIVDKGKEPARAEFIPYSDLSQWKDIRVPANWEMQGFGIPVYTNIKYVFPANPPFLDNNDLPIGTYRTRFEVPETFAGKFEGYDAPICFNARYNADEDFDPGLTKKQQHPIDIDPRNALYVNIDLKQSGLGDNNSWGARPLQQYRLSDVVYTYSYVIRPTQ